MRAYKVAEHYDERVLVTLEIPSDAITNIYRESVVVMATAKHRANKAFVVKIKDEEGNSYDTATSSIYQSKTLVYKVGCLVEEPCFDMDLNRVSGEGIHFFLSKQVAILYGLTGLDNGLFEAWHGNGLKFIEANYNEGIIEGLYQSWHSNGQKAIQVNYVKGEMEGLFQSWHRNGQKACECTYKNGVEDGVLQKWNTEGYCLTVDKYVCGEKQAKGLFTKLLDLMA